MANEPMLLDLNDWGVDQVLWLPGVSGNYASIPDVNRLWSSTVTLEQDQGQWITNNWQSTGERSQEITPYFGNYVWKITTHTNSGAGNHLVRIDGETNDSIPVTAGNTYTYSVYVNSATTSRNMSLIFRWYDATGTGLGDTGGDTATATVVGDWIQLDHTGTAPANATHVNLDVSFTTGGVADEVHYFDGVMFVQGTNTTFLPSTRIVGDLDIRVAFKEKSWNNTMGLLTKNNAYRLLLGDADRLRFGRWNAGALTESYSNSLTSYKSHMPLEARVTYESGTGAINYYVSINGEWKSVGVGDFADNTPPDVSGSGLEIGSRDGGLGTFGGAYNKFELRDGIEGPIVASSDFTDTAQASGDQFDSPEGHQVTINKNNPARPNATNPASLVQKNAFSLSTNGDRLTFYDRDEIDIGLNDDVAIAGLILSDRGGRFVQKNSYGASNKFYNISGGGANWEAGDGNGTSVFSLVSSPAPSAGQDFLMKAEREAGTYKIAFDDNAFATGSSTILDLANTSDAHYGTATDNTGYQSFKGFYYWFAMFKRALTAAEWTELYNWDGTVANEPVWVRDDAVLYVNADDPAQARQYRADYGVINLAYDVADDVPSTLYVRETLTTEDSTVTPSIDDFYIEVYPGVRDVEDEINPIEGTGYGGLKYAEEPALFRAAGQSIRFDGEDDYVDISHVAPLVSDNSISIEFWFNRQGWNSNHETVVGNGGGWGNPGWQAMFVDTGVIRFEWGDSGGTDLLDTPTSYANANNEWHHYVATFDGNRAVVYVDGVQVATENSPTAGLQGDSGYPTLIGDAQFSGYSGKALEALIDDLAIYDYALEPSEVAQHYNIGWRGKYSLMQDGDIVTIGADSVDTTDYAWQIIKG